MVKSFKLYRKITGTLGITIPEILNEYHFTYKVFSPKLLNTGLDKSERFKRLLWFIITRGKLRILYFFDGTKIVHYSFVITKNLRFPFMAKSDLQIGPCFTNSNYRGKGLYTRALTLIPELFSHQTDTFWIYTTEKNIVSQHAIEKAGYVFQGRYMHHGIFRILKKIKD